MNKAYSTSVLPNAYHPEEGKWVAFVRDVHNPLCSVWKFFATKEEAQKWLNDFAFLATAGLDRRGK